MNKTVLQFFAGAIIRHAPDRLLIAPKYFGSIEGRLNQQKTSPDRIGTVPPLWEHLVDALRFIHPTIFGAVSSSPFVKGGLRGIFQSVQLRKISPSPSLEKRGINQ